MGRGKCWKVLSYSRQGLTDYDLHNLALAEESVTYEEVDFSQNKLSSAGLRAVVDLCCRCEKLRVVKLYKNEIDDSGAKQLARLLQQCPTVEEFHLSHNRLTAKGVRIIVKAADGARSASARPLWMRVEMNEIEDPDKVLLDLERRLSVCGREDENSCTARVCCWSCKTHLPFMSSQRQPSQVPAQNMEPTNAKSKGKGTGAAALVTAQSKGGKDTHYGDSAASQQSSTGRKGKGNAGKQESAECKAYVAKQDYIESKQSGTAGKGNAGKQEHPEGKGSAAKQNHSEHVEVQAASTARKGKGSKAPQPSVQTAVGKGKKAQGDDDSARTAAGKGKKAQGDDEKESEESQKLKVSEDAPSPDACSKASSEVNAVSKPAKTEPLDEPVAGNQKTDAEAQSQDMPNKVELAAVLGQSPPDRDPAAKQFDPTPVDLSELIPGGVEKDRNVMILEMAWRAKDVMTNAEDEQRVTECLAALNIICKELEPDQVWQATAIGSVASGFGTKGCDFDVVVNKATGQEWTDTHSVLLKLRNLLSESEFLVKSTILQARVPILKLEYKGHDIDLSACNIRPQKNTRLLKAYGMMHDRVGELVVAVKLWAKDAGLCGAKNGHLSSYALVLMVIYFLQVMEAISLPCLQEGGSKDAAFDTDAGAKARAKEFHVIGNPALEASFEVLLGGFFAFYAGTLGPWSYGSYDCIPGFDWGTEVVSVRLGRRERRHSDAFSQLKGRNDHRLHIEDPFELSRNLNDVLWTHPVANETQLYQNLQCMDATAKMVHLQVIQLAPPPIFSPMLGPAPFFPHPIPGHWDPNLLPLDIGESVYSSAPEQEEPPSEARGKPRSRPVRRQLGKKGPYNSMTPSVHGRVRA